MESQDPLSDPDTLYVRSNADEGPVTRYGVSAGIGSSVFIGATRDPENPNTLVFSSDIVAIPGAEVRKYLREYRKALQSKALLKATEAEWREQEETRTREPSSTSPPTEQPAPESLHAEEH